MHSVRCCGTAVVPWTPRYMRGLRQPRPVSRLQKPPDFSGLGWPGQRLEAGTPAMTWLTCMPQPAQVVLPQVLQVTARHMMDLLDLARRGEPVWHPPCRTA